MLPCRSALLGKPDHKRRLNFVLARQSSITIRTSLLPQRGFFTPVREPGMMSQFRYLPEYSCRSNTLPSSPLSSTIIFGGFFVNVIRM